MYIDYFCMLFPIQYVKYGGIGQHNKSRFILYNTSTINNSYT